MDKKPKKPYIFKCERPPERALRRGETAKMARIVKKMHGPDSRGTGKKKYLSVNGSKMIAYDKLTAALIEAVKRTAKDY